MIKSNKICAVLIAIAFQIYCKEQKKAIQMNVIISVMKLMSTVILNGACHITISQFKASIKRLREHSKH